jgi:hypothetical protein
MKLADEDIAPIVLLLSPERLGSLMQLTGSSRTSIELHQQTLALGASLMNVIASLELAIRNAVCENLSDHFGVSGWLITPPAPFQWKQPERDRVPKAIDSAKRAEYSKMTQAAKAELDTHAFPKGRPSGLSHLKRAKMRRQHIAVSDGKIIAELTLHFWKRLYGPDYEQTLWKTTLKRTFPYKKLKRAAVAEHLERVYQARNRLAHHEPVLHHRFHDTMSSIQFLVEHLGADRPDSETPLAHLIRDDLAAVKERAEALHERLESFRTVN